MCGKVFLNESDLMPTMQSAYRAGHSTEIAVLKVLSDILDAVDSRGLLGLLDVIALLTPLISRSCCDVLKRHTDSMEQC